MGVSIIDGTIETAEFRRKAAKVRIYKSIVFRLADGETRTILKPIAHPDVAEHLEPGASGRFYLFTSIDHRGLHGVRTAAGAATYAYPKNNEMVGLVLFLIAIVWVGIGVLAFQGIPVLGAIVLILGAIVWIVNRKLRGEARRQFEADNPSFAPRP